MAGWIKLHKSIMDNWVWDDPMALKAWLDLLITVNYKDKKTMVGGSLVEFEAGMILTSTLKLSERWGCTRRKTEALLNAFADDQMIDVKKYKNGKLVKVLKYKDYQGFLDGECATESTTKSTTESTTESTTQRTTESTQHKNIKNSKEEKEEKNNKGTRYFPNDDHLEDTFKDFLKMRKAIRKPMTERAIDIMLRKLEHMTTDPREQVKILEQSIANSWADIYELKNRYNRNNQSGQSMADKWGIEGDFI